MDISGSCTQLMGPSTQFYSEKKKNVEKKKDQHFPLWGPPQWSRSPLGAPGTLRNWKWKSTSPSPPRSPSDLDRLPLRHPQQTHLAQEPPPRPDPPLRDLLRLPRRRRFPARHLCGRHRGVPHRAAQRGAAALDKRCDGLRLRGAHRARRRDSRGDGVRGSPREGPCFISFVCSLYSFVCSSLIEYSNN